MQWFYGHLEFFILGMLVTGIAIHFLELRKERRRYRELRREYEEAIRETRDSGGAPPAIVREAELRRFFAEARMPGWLEGLGRTVTRWAKVSAVVALVALFLRGPILRGEESYARRVSRGGVAATSPRASPAHRR